MNNFRYYVPIDDLKKGKDKNGKEVYKFKGLASTASEDSDGEFLDPEGFDLNSFKYVNYNHFKEPKYIIGMPTKAKIEKGQFLVEGDIWADTEVGGQVVDLMQAMKRNGSNSRLGISVEGRAIERSPINPKRVTKAKITAIALCPIPKNGDTWAELIQKGFVNDEEPTFDIQKSQEANGGNTQYIIDIINDGLRYTIDKNFKITIQKAMSTASAGATMKEDLEGKIKNNVTLQKAIITLAKAKSQNLLSDVILEKVQNKLKNL